MWYSLCDMSQRVWEQEAAEDSASAPSSARYSSKRPHRTAERATGDGAAQVRKLCGQYPGAEPMAKARPVLQLDWFGAAVALSRFERRDLEPRTNHGQRWSRTSFRCSTLLACGVGGFCQLGCFDGSCFHALGASQSS